MTVQYSLRHIMPQDAESIVEILNHYVDNGFKAYIDQRMDMNRFAMLFKEIENMPNCVCCQSDKVIGFGFLRPYSPLSTFSSSMKSTYFLSDECTGKGIGTAILNNLTEQAKSRGIKVILASISSLNQGSIGFHLKHGFIKCGEFKNIIDKNGTVFSEVWMQKDI